MFLTDRNNKRDLFKGTYIENSYAWGQVGSAPVFEFDFKNLTRERYKEQIKTQIIKHIYDYVDVDSLKGFSRFSFNNYLNDNGGNPEGLLILTGIIYEITGKRSYILIDEYDKLLTDNYNHEDYENIKEFETAFLGAGLKGNHCLEKALLTGVMRVSRESMLSGLNNLATYDIFSDKVYTEDFGFMDYEIDELLEINEEQKFMPFDKKEIKGWYNGVKINGKEIYNTYSVLSCIQNKELGSYWGRSGSIDVIVNLMNENRKEAIAKLLNNDEVEVFISRRISLHELNSKQNDNMFYSLLAQSEYLSLEKVDVNNIGTVRIPNKELINVWKEFILSVVSNDEMRLKTLFDHIDDLKMFDRDMEYFLSDRLSHFEIEETEGKTSEKIYHIFVLGLLAAYEDIAYKKPLSNRESGDGRYDIFFERGNFNIIFEFKSVLSKSKLKSAVLDGLKQIDEKRYYADIPKNKPLIKTAIAFCGKWCCVKSSLHVW